MTRQEAANTIDLMLMHSPDKELREALKMARDVLMETAWTPASESVPANEDKVLLLINGKSKNITWEHCPVIAEYWPDEGWILSDTDKEPDEFEALAWMPVPEWEGEE